MIEKNREVRVTNRGHGVVGYTLNEMGGLRRQFQHGETKTVTFEELEKLSWAPGGMYILQNELVIYDPEVVKALLGSVEPEYNYTESDIRKLIQFGTLDQFLDCLDFAPAGVLELVKKLAVEMPCNDVRKREAIAEKLGFNVTNAIELIEAANEGAAEASPSHRRASPINDEATAAEQPKRRYTVTNK